MGLIRPATAGWCACSRRCSARMRRHLPHSLRGRPRARRTRRCAARSLSGEAAASPVEAKPAQQNGKRQGDPGRECDDEHGKRNAENERVHPVVVVVPDSSDVPRTGDPRRLDSRRHTLPELSPKPACICSRDRPRMRPLQGSSRDRRSALADLRSCAELSRMRMRGLEPPRPYGHTDLNRARLPIPPHPRGRPILASGRLSLR